MTIETNTTEAPPKKLGELRREAIDRTYNALARDTAVGDVAALRRMRVEPGVSAPPAFWRYLLAYAEPLLPAGTDTEDRALEERRWAVVFRTIAQLQGQHRLEARVGGALAEADVQEPRVLRLLRSRGDALFDQLRVLAHQLASKNVSVDVAALAELLFHEDDARGEALRRQIARDFYAKTARIEE